MSRCQPGHKHRLDDLLACGIAGMTYDQFLIYTEEHCRDEEGYASVVAS